MNLPLVFRTGQGRRRFLSGAIAAAVAASFTGPALAGEAVDRVLGGALMIGGIAGAIAPGPHTEARPNDELPRGSWVYDVLAQLARDGKLPFTPEYFRDAHPMTRGEVARLIAPLVFRGGTAPGLLSRVAPPADTAPPPASASAPGTTPAAGTTPVTSPAPGTAPEAPTDGVPPATGTPGVPGGLSPFSQLSPAIRLLAWEFRYELWGQTPVGLRTDSTGLLYGAYVRGQLGILNGHVHPRILLRGDLEGSVDGAQYTLSAGNLNPGGFNQPFHLGGHLFSMARAGANSNSNPMLSYDPDSLYLRGIDRAAVWDTFSGWKVELGRDWLNWGPAYSGNLLISDNAGPLDMLLVTKDFDMGRFGTWRFEQFQASDPEPEGQRYLLGRRLGKALNSHVDGAVSEALLSQGTPPPYALVLPFYVAELLKNKHRTESTTDTESYLLDFQLAYRTDNLRRYYGDILIDEIVFPIPFGGEKYTHRKAGFLLGMEIPRVTPGIQKLILEAVYTDANGGTIPSTYEHFRSLLDYARYGNVIGSPIGPGSSGLVARADLNPIAAWRPFLQATVEQHHRFNPSPDVEVAGWVGAARSLPHNTSVNVTLRPFWVHNPGGFAGSDSVHLDGQVYLSAAF